MPHDVTMPQLGMAQDAGKIVAWLKAPGDAVAKGDALFEVETDKATMEVEAQANGFLTGVKAGEGEDVPVGAVIARISDTADDTGNESGNDTGKDTATDTGAPADPAQKTAAPATVAATDDLPQGKTVTMPQLGMAQDTGLLVNWMKEPGDQVAAEDVLFEVETDKSTMEVEAGTAGYLAATLANAGEDVPVGQAVAIISAEAPDNTVVRSVNDGKVPASEPSPPEAPKAEATPQKATKSAPPVAATNGRILASPKARRLALQEGLDLSRLVDAGHPQPFHVSDLDTLRALPAATPTAAAGPSAATRLLTAETDADGFDAFAAWAAEAHGLTDADQLLAGFVAASLGSAAVVAVVRHGQVRRFKGNGSRALTSVVTTDEAANITLRDLRGSHMRSLSMGAEETPVLTIMETRDGGLTLSLESAPQQMDAQTAITLLTEFAGRMEQPLRHLL